ncbi:sulfatase [Rhodopirellula sp. MGV]|uniref:sulfatase family protein n=1 Tax=Rhodopirellula sp. MGV TaxID=2023130 RepID=UPI000B95D158|nr:sulfatase [Rhodopirellula sp. MGV]OYP34584.1 heparan N-sulfatase [Rhodopirellula sp. MGV]PNY37313.1 heparan N-sulfatase [Rhodopirellula baltica]
MRTLYALLGVAAVIFASGTVNQATAQTNLLLITVDDMSCDSVGAFGCELEGTTPNIDALAASGLRYNYAHVQVGNCFPSRNVMWSGRYPHNTGVEGFYQVRDASHPHLVDLMKKGGYYVAIRGKVSHSTPYQPYGWDDDLTTLNGEAQDMKNPESYYRSTKHGIQSAADQGKPFCLNINISDPHKPFYAMGKKGQVVPDSNVPSRVYTADEVPIPGFLFDDPDVRLELAHYYSSVRRADDCVGQIMKALAESGLEDNTAIVFLSDHGMPLPFAKTALWHHSTRTPLIVRWPEVTQAGEVDREHMVSAVDLLPTILDIAGLPQPGGFDGRSFAPTLRGESQSGRDQVYKVYNENSGGNRSPMRSVQSKRFGYLFNAWPDGKRVFRTATTGTLSYRAMVKLAPTDPEIAKRLELFQHGVREEFYDYENDPNALVNLIDDPRYQSEIAEHRAAMRQYMESTGDHMLQAFDSREDDALVSEYVERKQAEADARRAGKNRGNRNREEDAEESDEDETKPKQDRSLFRMNVPGQAKIGEDYVVVLRHRLPEDLGQQSFHVTLKDDEGKRIERIVKEASGDGRLEFNFKVPESMAGKSVSVAAFVGESFQTNRLYLTKGDVKVD